MTRVVALLDTPSAESMGAVPIVLQNDGSLSVSGLADSRSRMISDQELQELVSSRQAVRVSANLDTAAGTANPVAMWIGKQFASQARALDLPPPPLVSDDVIETVDGRAGLGHPEEVHARLTAWLEKAFRHAIESSSVKLARLMTQVMPDHELTRAALWNTAPKREKEKELEWFVRLERDAGRAADPQHLRQRFENLRDHPPLPAMKVVLVTGKAGTRHREAAEELTKRLQAQRCNAGMVSFGQYLRVYWKRLHGENPTQPELQELGQEWVSTKPFLFTRQVLAERPATANVLIVDGVRHRVISDAIEFMVDTDPKQFAVTAPEPLVKRRLAEREGTEAVRGIMEHATEQEIPELLRRAKQVLRYDESFHLDEDVLREASQRATT